MLLSKWMSRPVVTLHPKESMRQAREMMTQYNIRALPVIYKDRLVGMLTDRDLRRAEASDATTLDRYELNYILEKVQVRTLMVQNPIALPIDATLSEAADLFLELKLEVIPIVDAHHKVIGIVTPSDIEKAFLKLTSFERRGIQFGIQLTNSPGAVMGVIAAVRNINARLTILITTDHTPGEGKRDVYLHIYDVNRDKLQHLIEELNSKGTLLYIIDFTTGDRQIITRKKEYVVA